MTDLENRHRYWVLHVLLGFYIHICKGSSYGHGGGAFIISLYEMPSRKLMRAEADSDETRGERRFMVSRQGCGWERKAGELGGLKGEFGCVGYTLHMPWIM